jgi:NAD(P)H-dependent FMN reductase
MPKILAFAGSARKDSFNKKLVRLAAQAAEAAGAYVTLIDLADYPLPLFHEDLEAEQGPPQAATALKRLFFEHEALLLACPEYNSSITPLLKNTLDWVSRRAEGEKNLQAFQGKVAALLAASPGALGGLRGLVVVRMMLNNIGVLVIPDQQALPHAPEAFDEGGQLKEAAAYERLQAVVRRLVAVTRALSGGQ